MKKLRLLILIGLLAFARPMFGQGGQTTPIRVNPAPPASCTFGNIVANSSTGFYQLCRTGGSLWDNVVTSTNVGGAGQVLISNGPGIPPSFVDPAVSYTFMNMFNAVNATATRTSAIVRNPLLSSGTGRLYVTGSGITGSPSGCTVSFNHADSLGNIVADGSTPLAITVANNTASYSFTLNIEADPQVQIVYACSAYPSAGTLSMDVVPELNVAVRNNVNTTVTNSVAVTGTLSVIGNVSSGQADSFGPVKVGGVFNTTQPTVTTGQRVDAQSTARGGFIVATGVDTFTVTANAGTNLNTSALALDSSVNGLLISQGSTTSGQKGPLVSGAVTTSAPSYTTAQSSPLSLDTSGNLRTVCANCGGGSGGTAMADEGSFTQGTTNFTPVGGFFNNAVTNLTTGQGGAVQLTNTRHMKIDLEDLAGTALGAPSNYGTSPGAVSVLGMNAFVTNTPSVAQSGAPWSVVNSFAFVNLFNAIGATVTRTSVATRNPVFSQTGTLQITWAGITGSPAGCTLQIQGIDSLGNILNSGSAVSVTPANGTTSQIFTGPATLASAAQIGTVYSCSTYPTAGTLTLDFAPILNVNIQTNAPINVAQIAGATTATLSAGEQKVGVEGLAASGSAKSGNPVQGGLIFNTTQPTVTTGQVVESQGTARGAAIVATGVDAFNVNASQSGAPWSVVGTLTNNNAAPGANNIGVLPVRAESSAPSYTTGNLALLSEDLSGNLRVSLTGSNTVSGTVTANQGVPPWSVVGNVASGSADSGNPVKTGLVFNTTQPTVTSGQRVDSQGTARGGLIVATGADTFTVTANAGTNLNTSLLALESGGNLATLAGGVSAAKYQSAIVNWAGSALGAMANYGTSPGSVLVPGMNAFVTNTPSVVIQSNATVTLQNASGAAVGTTANPLVVAPTAQLALITQPVSLRGMFGLPITPGNPLPVVSENPADPCSYLTKIDIAISQTATTRYVQGSAFYLHVCQLRVIAAAAEIVSEWEGTGSNCGTNTVAHSGSTTTANGEPLGANFGFQEGTGSATVIFLAPGRDFCLAQNGGSRVSGKLSYVLANF